jgi:hypothetical protein
MTPRGGAREGAGRKKKDYEPVYVKMERSRYKLLERIVAATPMNQTEAIEAAVLLLAKKHKVPAKEPDESTQ